MQRTLKYPSLGNKNGGTLYNYWGGSRIKLCKYSGVLFRSPSKVNDAFICTTHYLEVHKLKLAMFGMQIHLSFILSFGAMVKHINLKNRFA